MSRLTDTRLWNEATASYRMLRRPRHVRVHGVSVVIDPDWLRSDINSIYRNEWEADEVHVLRSTLQRDDHLLEIGAGLGVVTTVACRCVGADRVTSIDANPALIPVITATTRRNGFRPTVVNAVLGDSNEPRDFYVHREFQSSSLKPVAGAMKVSVPGRRFDDELARIRPTYLMIDIEGGEVELLNRKLPATVRAVCLETHARLVGDVAINELVTSLISQGLMLDTAHSSGVVLCFRRDIA